MLQTHNCPETATSEQLKAVYQSILAIEQVTAKRVDQLQTQTDTLLREMYSKAEYLEQLRSDRSEVEGKMLRLDCQAAI